MVTRASAARELYVHRNSGKNRGGANWNVTSERPGGIRTAISHPKARSTGAAMAGRFPSSGRIDADLVIRRNPVGGNDKLTTSSILLRLGFLDPFMTRILPCPLGFQCRGRETSLGVD